jgi:cytochrome c oxidase subunit II
MLQWLPEDVSSSGVEIDALFRLIYLLTAVAFVAVMVTMLVFLFRYRAREGRRAVHTHGNTTLEVVWTVIPAAIFLWLGIVSKAQWEKIRVTMPPTDTEIRITAKQFNWEILYPGPDGQFGTNDDKQVDNEIHIPVGQPIRVILTSKDVIHSLFLPNLRFKQDAVPGRDIQTWFQANKPGRYEVPCAELCGFGHSGMKGWLYALSAEDYRRWQHEQWPQAVTQMKEGAHE